METLDVECVLCHVTGVQIENHESIETLKAFVVGRVQFALIRDQPFSIVNVPLVYLRKYRSTHSRSDILIFLKYCIGFFIFLRFIPATFKINFRLDVYRA